MNISFFHLLFFFLFLSLIEISLSQNQPLIDTDTPQSVYNSTTFTNEQVVLVYSDEFDTNNRNFTGNQQTWLEAIDNYNPTGDSEYYSPSAVTTNNGALVITATNKSTNGLTYTSGMVQSWNRVCFTGGVVEVNVSLPGDATHTGFWPAVWLLGNLGRSSYNDANNAMWPWTYDVCDQNSQWQKINKCQPLGGMNKTWGLNEFQGRGAPEIDIIETRANDNQNPNFPANLYSTLHFTPKNPQGQSYLDKGVYHGTKTTVYENGDALHDYVGAITPIDEDYYDGFHVYRVEWEPQNYVRWTLDGSLIMEITQEALRARNASDWSVGERMISAEPMALIFNLAMSNNWSPIESDILPASLEIDYVRVYQAPNRIQTSCSPPEYPTAEYIKENESLYTTPTLG